MKGHVRSIEAPKGARLLGHASSAVLVAALVALGDVVQASVRARTALFEGLDAGHAALTLVGLLLPMGAVAGIVSGLADVAAPPSLDARRAFAMWTSPSAWFTRAPDAFADAIAAIMVAAGFIAAIRASAFAFATGFHDQRLASSAAAVVALAIAAVAAVVFRIARRALRAIAARLGPVPSPIVLVTIGLIAAAIAISLSRNTRFARGDWFTPVAALSAILMHASLSASLVLRARKRAPRTIALGALCLLVSVVVPAVAVTQYTASSRVRILTEDFSRLGRALIPAYQRVVDADRDGFSPILGGGDCDDARADVRPGAVDEPDDGLDADCFAGDGTPTYVDRTPEMWVETPPAAPMPNVLLITVDALRPDHLGAYGYERPVSPHIDAFAREAVTFRDVTAQAPRTMRSMPSALTGMYPAQIAFGDQHVWPDLLPVNVTLAEGLGGSHSTSVVMATSYFENVPTLFQGFTQVTLSDLQKAERSWAVNTSIDRIDELSARDRPFFVWTHLFNVHEPTLHDRSVSLFGPGQIGSYDTEVLYADREIGRLLEHLETRGLAENTIVVLASDHGEALGEHGMWGHSSSLYTEQVASVLIINAPGFTPRTVSAPVALMDIFPTVLNLAGRPKPGPIAGRSLVAAMRGDEAHLRERDIFAEVVPDGLFPFDWKSIRRGDDVLIYWPETARVALFDQRRDPRQLRDISDARPDDTRALLTALRSWMLTTNRPETLSERVIAEARVHDIPDAARRLGLRYATGFVLEAVDVSPVPVQPGNTVYVDFYFRVEDTTVQDCFFEIFPNLPGTNLPSSMHLGHYPVEGRYRTNQFRRGELIRDRVSLRVPRTTRTPLSIPYTLRVLATDRSTVPWELDGRTGDVRTVLTLEIR